MSRLSIEIPDAVHRQIKAQASLQGISIREYVLRRLRIDPHAQTAQAEKDDTPAKEDYPASIWGWLERPTRGTRTKEEIDAYIAEERASWNDDE